MEHLEQRTTDFASVSEAGLGALAPRSREPSP